MIKSIFLSLFAGLVLLAAPAHAEVVVGEPAPEFTGTDTNGVEHSLSDFKGKTVVLEWTNHQCPYVEKFYKDGHMPKFQEQATADGVVWISVASSAAGKQGYTTSEEANAIIEEKGVKATARILDPSGEIGKLYGAKTTPHMFVIDGEGTLVYAGAIDSNPSFRTEDIDSATNYVMAALDALKAGEPVAVSQSQPYGCSVKY